MGVIFGLFFGLLLGGYYWQPLRYEFFPPQAEPGPTVSPVDAGFGAPDVRILIVVGHPDDSEFYLGGTLIQLARVGARVRLVCMTDGDKAFYPFGVPEGLTETRRAEQRKAAVQWGGDVVFLGYRDGRLPVNDKTVADLVGAFCDFAPDIVMAPDVLYRPRRAHSDHIDTGRNVERALKTWGNECTVALYNSRAPNCFIDITADWPGKKELVKIHESQFSGAKLDFIFRMLERRARGTGAEQGIEMAEGLRIIKVKEKRGPENGAALSDSD